MINDSVKEELRPRLIEYVSQITTPSRKAAKNMFVCPLCGSGSHGGRNSDGDLTDVRLLFNHDLNRVPLARTPKTMSLSVDPVGMTIRATLPNTESAREVYEAVKRSDLRGMSFAFKVPEGGDTYDPKTNTRTINQIEKVYECSIVQYPAYGQTSVEARSVMTESQKRLRQLQQLKNVISMIKAR